MKVVILAAGRGSRMGSLTEERPKCMTMISGETLLSRQMKSINAAKLEEICIIRGYKSELINIPNVYLLKNPRWDSTNMIATLLLAHKWIDSDDVIVAYSDIIYKEETLSKLIASNGEIVVANNLNWRAIWEMRFANPLDDLETFKVNSEGVLLEIGQKPKNLSEIGGQFMGLIKFTKNGWEKFYKLISKLENSRIDKLDMTSALNLCIRSKIKINTVDISDEWFEFDSESDILAYKDGK